MFPWDKNINKLSLLDQSVNNFLLYQNVTNFLLHVNVSNFFVKPKYKYVSIRLIY